MIAIDDQLHKVWNPHTRTLATEAWQCYNSGAVRASIATTWTAVTTDLIAKIGALADDGDGLALKVRGDIEKAQAHGLSPAGTAAMQRVENGLLDNAQKLELIDSVDERALARIREDRNICVHPSLRGLDAPYAPVPDVARAHLSVALDALLIHPPTQGKKILSLYKDRTSDPEFSSASPSHIQRLFYDRVRTHTRRNIVAMAAKHAVLEIDPGTGTLLAVTYADRSAHVLAALAERDRPLVVEEMQKCQDRYRRADAGTQRRALGRLGDRDYFWSMLDDPLRQHISQLVKGVTVQKYQPLDPTAIAVLSLVGTDIARNCVADLADQFATLDESQKTVVISARPAAYFFPHILALLTEAGNFRAGARAGSALLTNAHHLANSDLQQALSAWSNNYECSNSSEMPATSVALFRETAHLGQARVPYFRQFLATVCAACTDPDPAAHYRYPDLAAALNAA